MARPAPPSFTPPAPAFDPTVALSTTFFDGFFLAQRLQLETLAGWQQSWAALSKELWDGWACHFGGGVPLDG